MIWALRDDEQIDLVALAWLGRGDGAAQDWAEIREIAPKIAFTRTQI
ncbi:MULTISPECIES: DUF3775 domain-containing protein [unclassified Sinorhizobium]